MKVTSRRFLEEQIAVVVVVENGKKDDAMWHVPQLHQVNVASSPYPQAVHINSKSTTGDSSSHRGDVPD